MAGREFQRLLRRWRFIPAWAGNTISILRGQLHQAVHPRVGGEHMIAECSQRLPLGSSPRGRGTPEVNISCGRRHVFARHRFIPAWAGNTSIRGAIDNRPPVHPRVGGEHASMISALFALNGSSPRGRGTHVIQGSLEEISRFIPAWAGNTWRRFGAGRARPVHPRVGGEHGNAKRGPPSSPGSSPRGRGTPVGQRNHSFHPRFIPAWAGNT